MSETTPQATITISLSELKALIRQTVRDAVREELARYVAKTPPPLTENLNQEGLDDPEEEAELLEEALEMIAQYRQNKDGWQSLEEVEAELRSAEERGELPR